MEVNMPDGKVIFEEFDTLVPIDAPSPQKDTTTTTGLTQRDFSRGGFIMIIVGALGVLVPPFFNYAKFLVFFGVLMIGLFLVIGSYNKKKKKE